MAPKITGTVKWFSNRKGFGFIEPVADNTQTTDDIFVHQTSIQTENGEYRTLVEGMEVEFGIEKEESGKLKAIDVTAPGGGPIKPPKRERKRGPRSKGAKGGAAAAAEGEEGGATNGNHAAAKEPEPREPPFHDILTEENKAKVAAKGVDLGRKMTVDVALDEARIKLGQGGYAGLAHARGMVGEGTYVCDEQGQVTFTWERCIQYTGGKWVKAETSELPQKFSLVEDAIKSVEAGETAESLWGADKEDPKEAFVENGFKMKRVVLTRPPGGGRGRRGPKKE